MHSVDYCKNAELENFCISRCFEGARLVGQGFNPDCRKGSKMNPGFTVQNESGLYSSKRREAGVLTPHNANQINAGFSPGGNADSQ
jgi:hypothetical protein